jgi:dnaB-like helicase C terminal domain|nr:MAG TPA: DNA polymerase B Like Replicative Helicase [Caudoviricetes sp.]
MDNLQAIDCNKIQMDLDHEFLDGILGILNFKENSVLKNRKNLTLIYKLVSAIDLTTDTYNEHPKLVAKIQIITHTIEAILNENYHNQSIIDLYVAERPDNNILVKEMIPPARKIEISYDEALFIMESIKDRLNFGFVLSYQQKCAEISERIMLDGYGTHKELADTLYNLSANYIKRAREVRDAESEQTFSLNPPEGFDNVILDTFKRLKDKNKKFKTGIRMLNGILGDGYRAKRLYTYLALPGGGKSSILLKTALDIKKYNAGVIPTKPGYTPTILLITMENDVDETVERIYSMVVGDENFPYDEANADDDKQRAAVTDAIKRLKEDEFMTLTTENNIDIVIKYYPNQSISTDDLYTIIDDMEDDNREVIALILDYIKRIRPARKADSEKTELKNISNELKTLAKLKEIPVITAQQLNRNTATMVDQATLSGKLDVGKMMSRDGVGSSWEIIENSDVVIIIHQEVIDEEKAYMSFKLVKRRYKCDASVGKYNKLFYFNQPYVPYSTIKFVDDLYLDHAEGLTDLSAVLGVEDTYKDQTDKAKAVRKKREQEAGATDNPMKQIEKIDASYNAVDESEIVKPESEKFILKEGWQDDEPKPTPAVPTPEPHTPTEEELIANDGVIDGYRYMKLANGRIVRDPRNKNLIEVLEENRKTRQQQV